jgi:hypothetical protein
MFQPDQTAATCALWQGTAWRAGHFTFSAAPGGNAETDADQQCSSAAETTPGSRVMRKDQHGDHSQVQPYRTTQSSKDAAARPAASREYPGQREYGGVLGVVQPPAPGPPDRSADLSSVGNGCCGKKTGTRQRGQDEHCVTRRSTRMETFAPHASTGRRSTAPPRRGWRRRRAGREG